MRRLYDPVDKPEVSASELRRNLIRLLEPYRPDEARVRTIMTREGEVYLAIEPLKPLPKDVYEKGVRVETVQIQRATPRMKSTAFISASQDERVHLVQEGIFEALLVKNGKILEGLTSNFFYVKSLRAERSDEWSQRSADEERGFLQYGASSAEPQTAFSSSAQREVLYTTQRDILLGVTRKTIIRLARGRGVEVHYQPLRLDHLTNAEEAFITSSSRGVVPVVQIDDVTVGKGSPGPVTETLRLAYDAYVLKHAEKI